MKIKLAVLDKDQNYLNRVVSVFNNKYADKLEVYAFTDLQTALSNIESSNIDVLVADEAFKVDTSKLSKRCGFAYFVETVGIETLYDEIAICKFQKADLIYKEILGIYSETSASITGIKLDGNDEMSIITFVSASGGTGSSTAAAACAVSLARKGKKVLYLNVENFGNTKAFFQAEGQFDLNDVIYAVKSKRSNLALKLESTVKQDVSRVYFYDSCKMPLDIIGMGAEDMERLITELKLTSSYDFVIMDTDFTMDAKCFEILKSSRRIVFVSDGSEISNNKFLKAMLALKEIDKSNGCQIVPRLSLLYNKFSNKTSTMIPEDEVKSIGGAPKYDGASQHQVMEQLAGMNLFDEFIV